MGAIDAKPHIYFRADAAPEIGYGHFVRTLALADMLGGDFDKTFVTRHPTPFQVEQIKGICGNYVVLGDDHFDGFLNLLRSGDIVVLDNYFFDTDYQRKIKAAGCRLVCIDDMHDKHYVADVVINHGLTDASLFSIEPYTRLCLGLDWALLRKPFLNAKPLPKRQQGHCVVAFGGVDALNLTAKVALILSAKPNIKKITAIVGDGYTGIGSLGTIGKVDIRKNLSAQQMADLFCSVEFAVLPTSTLCIEALACSCPVFAGYYVNNQYPYYQNLLQNGYITPLGDLRSDDLDTQLLNLAFEKQLYSRLPHNENIYSYIFISLTLDVVDYTSLTPKQLQAVWEIRNLEQIRQFMTNSASFDFNSHKAFIEKLKNDSTKKYWAIFSQGEFVGGYSIVDIKNRCAERGLFISPLYQGKCYAKAIEYYMDKVISVIGVDKLYAEIKADNVRSLAYHKKCGYIVCSQTEQYYNLERWVKLI